MIVRFVDIGGISFLLKKINLVFHVTERQPKKKPTPDFCFMTTVLIISYLQMKNVNQDIDKFEL